MNSKILTLLWCYVPYLIYSQVYDPFTDQNFNNPLWFGDTSNFIHHASEIQLNDTEAGSSLIYTPTHFQNTSNHTLEWEIWFELDFAPSSSNRIKFYLAGSDSLTNNTYWVQLGESGSEDKIRLFEKGNSSPLLSSNKSFGNNPEVHLKIVKDEQSNFSFWLDTLLNNTWQKDTSVYLGNNLVLDEVGFKMNYTSTRKDKFRIKEVKVNSQRLPDTSPPIIDSIRVGEQNIQVYFSENINFARVSNTDFIVANHVVSHIDSISGKEVNVVFQNGFENYTNYQINVCCINDTSENILQDTSLFFYVNQSIELEEHDILINEVLADPYPPIDLPETEFIELYNHSNFSINLNEIQIADLSKTVSISSNYILPSNEYVVLCKSEDSALFEISNVLGLEEWPSLNNSSDIIYIKQADRIIDSLFYSSDYFSSSESKDGGISLERIRFETFCEQTSNNWKESTALSGGTPGIENSIHLSYPDNSPPTIDTFYWSDSEIHIVYSETIYPSPLTLFVLTPNNDTLNTFEIEQETLTIPLTLVSEQATIFKLVLEGIKDCEGNITSTDTLAFEYTPFPRKEEVVINEILFNPPTDGADFIELVNQTSKYLNLKECFLHRIKNGIEETGKPLSETNLILSPLQHLAFTSDSIWVSKQFEVEKNIIQVNSLPTMPDDSGSVILKCNQQEIDKIIYHQDYHFELLNVKEGVSLEKYHPSASGILSSSWHSSASINLFATPGYQNSNYTMNESSNTSLFELSSEIISPDLDGYQDQLFITYQLNQFDNVLNLTLYSEYGNKICTPFNQETLGREGTLIWNGLNDKQEKINSGMYLLLFEIYDPSGVKKIIKKPIVIAY